MALIALTQGHYAIVDDEDFEKVSEFKWTAGRAGNTIYAQRRATISLNVRKTILMHRFILGMDRSDKRVVDHKNGNGLDNRKENIRPCTVSQNSVNKNFKLPESGYRGVVKNKNRWDAVLEREGKRHKLSGFRCPTAAAMAYDKLSKKINGEFGRRSFWKDEK